jgi:hypothetical protein
MAERESELRNVAWSEVFPFLRLFRTFRLAIRPNRLLIALAAVAMVCLVGWVMDRIWVGAGHGALVDPASGQSEVHAYAALSSSDFAQWKADATQAQESRPAGDFASLLRYEMGCFAGAVRGVVTFHWGFSTPAWGPQPSFLGSLISAGRGVQWLVTQHAIFFIIYAIAYFAIISFFGGAICRSAAVEAARDEVISPMQALRFAWHKFGGLALGPALPAGIFAGVLVVFVVLSILGVVPWLGELVAGLLFGLAILSGFALAMILIGTVLGLHLTWPTVAAEGSDGFDAVSHAFAYVAQRPWYAAFYSWVLLLYGAVCFVVVRLIAMTTLKLTHVCSDWGMSFFGAASSARNDAVSKLDAMWHMPAWSDLSFLPSSGGNAFWGTFYASSVNWSEWLAAAFIAIWVAIVIGLVGAFVVSFFFCGSTQMYFLLRRNVDAVDYDEIYYEEAEPELPVAAGAPEPASAEAEAPAGVPAAAPESGGSA